MTSSTGGPFTALRAARARIGGLALVAGVLSLGACCHDSFVDDVFLIRDADPQLQTLIDRCRDPAQPDCLPLCRALTGQPSGIFEHCEMHPDRDGYQQVHAGYRQNLACFE